MAKKKQAEKATEGQDEWQQLISDMTKLEDGVETSVGNMREIFSKLAALEAAYRLKAYDLTKSGNQLREMNTPFRILSQQVDLKISKAMKQRSKK